MSELVKRNLIPLVVWLVLVVSVWFASSLLPTAWRTSGWFEGVFVDRWPWYAGGFGVAGVVLLLLGWQNRLLGVSTGISEICAIKQDPSVRASWRPSFLLGIVFGGAIAAFLAGGSATMTHGAFDNLVGSQLEIKLPVLLLAGVALGYGSRAAGGCTSGHGIVGTAQLAKSSLVATGVFIATGTAVAHVLDAFRG